MIRITDIPRKERQSQKIVAGTSRGVTAVGLAVSMCMFLNSCWFNSAGRIVDIGSHEAKVYASDAKIGSTVRSNGDDYYVEFDHYYDDNQPRFWASVLHGMSTKEKYNKGKQWYLVNPSYARYITGQSDVPAGIEWVQPVSESTASNGDMLRSVKVLHEQEFAYHHTSPNIGWYWAGASFEFLCVDIPMSALGNCFAILCGISELYRKMSLSAAISHSAE